jgi:hypothetical protein
MRALVGLVLGVVAVAASPAVATVYVPGQYKDGIYIRPHFLDGSGRAPVVPLLLPPDLEAAKAKEARDEVEPRAVPNARQPLPAS